MLGANQHFNFNHFEPLSKSGIYYFNVRIIKTAAGHIMIGICGGDIKSTVYSCLSPQFLGFNLNNGHLYGNGKDPCVASDFNIV